MRKTISYIALIILFVACSKNENKQVTVTGRLMQSCDTPAANKDGLIRLSGGGILANPSTSLEFTTDENGYFTVTHNESFSDFSVRTSAAHSVLEVESLVGDNKELGEVYVNPFPTNFVIKLDVQNPYTENDTLVMLNHNSSDPFDQLLIPGPFETGYIDSVSNYYYSVFPITWSEYNNETGPRGGVQFRLRSQPDYIGINKHERFDHTPICSGEFAEVTLKIE
jgi:hypothetical protein